MILALEGSALQQENQLQSEQKKKLRSPDLLGNVLVVEGC